MKFWKKVCGFMVVLSLLFSFAFIFQPVSAETETINQDIDNAQVYGLDTIRVSVASDGMEANNGSGFPAISADGNFVVFESAASNLVSGDTNGALDVFVYDIQNGITERVSVASDGTEDNGAVLSRYPDISGDGRYVVFHSSGDILSANDTNESTDVFLHDMQTGETTRISVASDGSQANQGGSRPSISSDGRYIAFHSYSDNLTANDTNSVCDIFVYDRIEGITERISVASDGSQGNGNSQYASINSDGRYVTFTSEADNLVSGDTNGVRDVFMYDRQTHQTIRVSVDSSGNQGNDSSWDSEISGNGNFITYTSFASNLVAGDVNSCIYYFGEVRSCRDVFVYDVQNGTTTLVSKTSTGAHLDYESLSPSINYDGSKIVFDSGYLNEDQLRPDMFLYNLQTETIEMISFSLSGSQPNGISGVSSISGDGKKVVFTSFASDIVENDTNEASDCFIVDISDLNTTRTTHLSNPLDGETVSGESWAADISADGRYAVFKSEVDNLVTNDACSGWDIFVFDVQTGEKKIANRTPDGVQRCGQVTYPSISADGRYVSFAYIGDEDLVTPSPTSGQHVYVHDMQTNENVIVSVNSQGEAGNGLSDNTFISGDGRFTAFMSLSDNLVENDTNGTVADVFVHDTLTGETELISVDENGDQFPTESGPTFISSNGRYVGFINNISVEWTSNGTVVDSNAWLYDRQTKQSILISTPNSGERELSQSDIGGISEDGRYVVFSSNATNLIENDTNGFYDVFLKDMVTGEISLISRSSSGEQGNDRSASAEITSDGRYVFFSSHASNLVPNDNNGYPDIFLFDRFTNELSIVSFTSTGLQGDGASRPDNISADGLFIVFAGDVPNFRETPAYDSGYNDVYLLERVVDLGGDQYEGDGVSALGTLIQSGQSQTHSIKPAWDEDWLTFTLDEPGVVTLETSGISGDTVLRLFDSDHVEIASDDNSGVNEFSRIEAGSSQDLLPAGTYYVKVEEDGDNAVIEEYSINLLVTDTLILAPGTYDDSSTAITYTGSWSQNDISGATEGHWHVSTTENGEAEVVFTGKQIRVIYGKDSDLGTLSVYIDDVLVDTIDENAASIQHQQIWESDALSSGEHTLRLVHSLGAKVVLDGLTVLAEALPKTPALLSPGGTKDTNNPLFVWYATSDATGYWLTVGRSSDGTYLFNSYVQPNTNGYTCWLNLPVTFADGDYWFKVTAGNDSGWGDASAQMDFSVSVSQPPEAPTLISPDGSIDTNNPLFVWYAAENANGYWLTVGRSSDGAYLFNSYVQPNTNGYTCWLNLPVSLSNGDYWFRVTAGNDSGWGDTSAQMGFSVSVSQPPDAPSLISPSGTVNTDNPLFVWYSTANASGYWLTVGRSSDGAYLFNSYVTPNTNGYTCWLNLPVTFANGNYWFKVTAGNASGWGDASEQMNFMVDQ